MIPAVTCVRRHSIYSGSFKSPRVLYGGRFFETGPASSIGDMRGKVYAASGFAGSNWECRPHRTDPLGGPVFLAFCLPYPLYSLFVLVNCVMLF